ncbi:MAG: hypothetical protein S0880_02510 [Actinomycetota bacterium]|nr:hypothetical protein [Actinomycetota bacterium]
MTMRRIAPLTVLLLGLALMVFSQASASAQAECPVTEVTAGDTIEVPNPGLAPGSEVAVTVGGIPLTLAVPADGSALPLTIPATTPPGDYTAQISGTGADQEPITITCTVTVLAAQQTTTTTTAGPTTTAGQTPTSLNTTPTVTGGGLPFTGPDEWVGTLGIVLAGLGALFLSLGAAFSRPER